ncbi:MAG: hypothetical protein IPK19_24160 [Chloroflexi bacterium]|nr:hypothetical protein [Chloroflexota bacterium]
MTGRRHPGRHRRRTRRSSSANRRRRDDGRAAAGHARHRQHHRHCEPADAPTFSINIVSYYQQGGVSGTPLNITLYGR